MEMETSYQPALFEDKIYQEWLDKKYFKANVNSKKQPYTIMMPPPNITGQLHMGHALNQTIQDVMTRFKRMKGFEALWLPGTDHASIATEAKIVEALKEEGLTKEQIGYDEFMKRAFAWKDKYGGRIVEQVMKLGSSCDWDRLAFTMDEKCSRAVLDVFVKLYNKGDIFKGKRIINWCPHCKTAISDAEVEYETEQSNFWHLKYMVEGSDNEFVIVATTRPETMLGDTAVAVNPNDIRYTKLVGKNVILPILNKPIPVVADDYVDMEFGTGAVKITPAHDPNDFEVGLRHNLQVIRVMNDDGTMNELAGKYEGQDRFVARDNIVADLKASGNLVKIEPHEHNTQHCYRCHKTVEPIVSEQWFVKMKEMVQPAIDAVRNGDIDFIPKRFEKIYFNWLENIKDWCISRQLWWGHRIPAYTCEDCGELMVQVDAPKACCKCGSSKLKQDDDVLDTWFSSALWPFATLGYPENNEDLKYFYPGDALITAYDIIFFWVARMVFSGFEHMKEKPFSKIVIHGIVRDAQGRKMSKSLGNGIDPLEIIDKYGADTLRFSLINGISAGGDTRFSDEKVEASRNFMNKIWNASRFVLMNIEGKELPKIDFSKLTLAEKWILTRLNQSVKDVSNNLEKYELGLASTKLYDFVWSDFCDWYIELSKPVFYGEDNSEKLHSLSVIKYVLEQMLKILHPFVPFITEEIYSKLETESIMIQEFPKFEENSSFEQECKQMQILMDIIKGVRNLRAEMNVPPKKKTAMFIKGAFSVDEMAEISPMLQKMAYCDSVELTENSTFGERVTSVVTADCEVFIPLGQLIDKEVEIERKTAELKKVESEIARAEGKLNNQGFVSKAPAALLESEREKLANFIILRDKLKSQLEEII